MAGGFALERAGENFHHIRLFALGGETRLRRTPRIEIGLDIGLAQRDARRAPIDHAADGLSVTFAPARERE